MTAPRLHGQRMFFFPRLGGTKRCASVDPEVEVKTFTRITVDPNQMGGLPCIRGLRIPVATVVGMASEGLPQAEILSAYPDLEVEDIREALRYAAEAVRERELPVAGGS
jgi:uncharacterized protein (DUF433 family)